MFSRILNHYRYRRGAALLRSGKTAARGLRLFGKAADGGHADAQYQLGLCYLQGRAVPVCYPSAVQWLRAAAERGHAVSQCRLASLHLGGYAAAEQGSSTSAIFGGKGKSDQGDFAEALRWALEAAKQGAPEGLAILGFIQSEGPEAYRDEAAAWRAFEESSKAGLPKGQAGLALMMLKKTPRTQDDVAEARSLLRKSADGGEVLALYHLGVLAEADDDIGDALAHYRKSAQAGIVEAQHRLGMILLNGPTRFQNHHEGEGWLRRAGNAGNAKAATLVGDLYAQSVGLPPNYQEAALWYHRAADGGSDLAARKLGHLYLSGNAGIKSIDEAIEWLGEAVRLGNVLAVAELGELLRSARTIPPRLRGVALRALAVRADRGDMRSALELAFCLKPSELTEQFEANLRQAAGQFPVASLKFGQILLAQQPARLTEARQLILAASDAGVVEAQVAAAEMLLNGRGGEVDPSRAFLLFEGAAEQGHVGAMFALAFLLQGNYGLPREPDTAFQWMQKAAERGHTAAQFALGRSLARQAGTDPDRSSMAAEAKEWLRRAEAAGDARATTELQSLGAAERAKQPA